MDWAELYVTLFDFQDRRCMVQVHLAGSETPLLTAFGSLRGGPNGEVLGGRLGDTIVLSLASSVQGANGAIMLHEDQFEGAEQPSPIHLTILHGGARLGFAFTQDDEPPSE